MEIINELLKKEPYKSSLEDYILVSIKELNTIPLGSHIKFIDRNENLKSGGFVIKYVNNKEYNKCYIILKSNIIYKLYGYYYWIFYKKIDKTTSDDKRQIFVELLNSL